MEPMSPALEGEPLTTRPPGKSLVTPVVMTPVTLRMLHCYLLIRSSEVSISLSEKNPYVLLDPARVLAENSDTLNLSKRNIYEL